MESNFRALKVLEINFDTNFFFGFDESAASNDLLSNG